MSVHEDASPTSSSRMVRGGWLVVGLSCVGLGALGVVVPGLPTTVFFIGAAACFARSSPRLERWVLGLPTIGPLVQDYRDGLGMPRRAKGMAIAAIAVAVSLSLWAIPSWIGRSAVATLGLVGIAYIALQVPTRERVLAERIRRDRIQREHDRHEHGLCERDHHERDRHEHAE
ncbi:MAG: YbaN family protein [Bacteroidota bacterium]